MKTISRTIRMPWSDVLGWAFVGAGALAVLIASADLYRRALALGVW